MSTIPFRRQQREKPPEMPAGDIELQEPPSLPELQPKDPLMMLMMVPMMLISGVMMLVFLGQRNPALAVGLFLGMLGLAILMVLVQLSRAAAERRNTVRGDRRDFMRYLGQVRSRVRGAAARQRASLTWRHPDPASLANVAMTGRLWERRGSHGDFGEVRIGTGSHSLSQRITPLSTKPIADLEPLSARALRRFIAVHGSVPDLPVSLFLRRLADIRLMGDEDAARAMVRAMVAQAVTAHAPDELRIAVCTTPERAADWDWVKWLPHAQHPSLQDGAGSTRLFGVDVPGFIEMLDGELNSRSRFEPGAAPTADEPYHLVVFDGVAPPTGSRIASAGYRCATTLSLGIEVDESDTSGLLLDVHPEVVHIVRTDRTEGVQRTAMCAPDRLSVAAATALVRVIAPYRVGSRSADASEPMVSDFELPTLLGIDDVDQWSPEGFLREELDRSRLRIPLGVDERGHPVALDIKEAAQGGMGPHGLLIGATGSGKSELLRTLVLGMAMTHSSETLNFVLVDFKGGATFLGLDELPHVSALITNLADEATLVTRMQDALAGELNRRQEYLRAAGNYSSLLEHEKARLAGAPLEAMPTLFVIVDEFSELLASNPDFAELFVMIGRLGRSLGVHLLLASQRLEDGRMTKLESHLSYRIGLRTFSAMESRSVIGVPDAHSLPNAPGNGYLRSDVATLTRFKAAYVSGAYRRRTREQRQEEVRQQVVLFGASPVAAPAVDDAVAALDGSAVAPAPIAESSSAGAGAGAGTGGAGSGADSTVMGMIVDKLVGFGPPAHQVWLPPLGAPPTLDQLLPPLLPDPDRGLHAIGWTGSGHLSVPIGVVDKPYEQTRELYEIDLAGAGGNVGVAGGPQSGKTALLRTMVSALALTHTPAEVQFYCIDFGGGGLSTLEGLPHVGGVATRRQGEQVARTIAEVRTLLREREQLFTDESLEGMAEYRARRAAGELAEQQFGDVFLVVDGWSALRAEFEEHDLALRELARQGLAYGVHVMISTSRWTDVHSSLRDQLGTRVELKLGDPIDSVHGMRKAATVPQLPGRGITAEGMHFLAGVPRIDGATTIEGLATASRDLGEAVLEAWSGPVAPAVRMLPAVLDAALLPAPTAPGPRIALGHGEQDLEPVWHDFAARPHLSIVGDSASGKTGALRLLASGVVAAHGPDAARITVIDPRRGVVESVPDEYQFATAFSTSATEQVVAKLVAELRERVPSADITPAQLRRRDWWSGPEHFVFVDDYDLLLGTMGGPLTPLVELIPQAGDIGLHLILARAGAGSSRTAMDAVIRRLHESNTPELTLSLPASEPLTFTPGRGKPLPPGRASLLTRRGGAGLQIGWTEPPE
ncbi:type VII secretion protein EccCa [Schumannella sp. 10F1B-5-1]|uniref:type VII secretion protein EccCa n=1 Tax=Schumannella sp. 10F1B-5-1 TaxID=2590780 RepID=UPI00113186BA|nr:type VII secretion protein EccCa [Schumannella sp. 10F1B-5-1]TPW78520.1 type VII secretion protein EccCa [Schumannella sp. 10F1B-5-1]